MRIAVTGGAGKVGTVVVRRLVELRHDVIVLDKRPPVIEGVRFVYLDLRNREVLQPAIEGCDAVIHLGELSHQFAGESPQQVYATNCAIGSTVMQTAADLKVGRFIYTSSCQVYGHWGGGAEGLRLPVARIPMDESYPQRPLNSYALSKASNEQFASLTASQHGLSIATFRLPHVIVPQSVERWVRRERQEASGGFEYADGFWTFVHAEDVADAYALAVESRRSGCEAYHVFSPDISGFLPLHKRLESLGLSTSMMLPSDWPAQAAPVTTAKAQDHFGWRAQRSWQALAAAIPER